MSRAGKERKRRREYKNRYSPPCPATRMWPDGGRAAQLAYLPFAVLDIIRSGASPDEPMKWYDRAIRIVGGIAIALVLIVGMGKVISDLFNP